jgi:ATP-dependent helicase/nuclease subunit A
VTGGLLDRAARERITTDTASTLFVDAGAGSGKTTALVGRILRLVTYDRLPLSAIAAVTFTEKAGAELRDRLRVALEDARRGGGDRDLLDAALDDLDGAAIGTLHSFAQRILLEHPIEAGLPPVIEVLDEVGSGVAFDERWSGLQTSLLDDDETAPALLLALAAGVTLKHLRALTQLLGRDWDLIAGRVLADPPPMPAVDWTGWRDRARFVVRLGDGCTSHDDKLLVRLGNLELLIDELDAAVDDAARVGVLTAAGTFKVGNVGQAKCWGGDAKSVREAAVGLCAEAGAVVARVQNACIRRLTAWLAVRVLDAAESRRRSGQLEFHDLLVLARDVLVRDADVRAELHNTYQRLLLDEFQDTDPIQIELAARICGGRSAVAVDWREVKIPPGRLFVVGDPKQSIYRFRRASIATYLAAADRLGERVSLTSNFRTVGPILHWVNHVFGVLIVEKPDAQPAYVPLDVDRTGSGTGPAVTVLGADTHTDEPKAAELRARESVDVAAVVRQALDEGWQVFDEKQQTWRAAQHGDIAVLVPSRTSLPYLEDAFESAGVPYRAESSSLVYQARDVRELLACARAIGDTSDALSLVTALRSPLFGCGDDDLWRWKAARCSFTIFSRTDDPNLTAGPVGAALSYLRGLHDRGRWLTPSEVLAAIVADRRMLEIAATGPRPRDSWRRLRFVIDQARAWSEASPGGLRAYLAWASRQGQEVGRVAEAVLPETDANAVRILTMHAAKGLEFPIVVMSGMTSRANRQHGVQLLWPPAGGYEARLSKTAATDEFAAAIPVDEQMDDLERLRLLYVGATRARDHLIVSLHRSAKVSDSATPAGLIASAGGADGATAFTGYVPVRRNEPASGVTPPPELAVWEAEIAAAVASAERVATQSASGLEGTEPAVQLDPERQDGLAKGGRDLELPPWSKGRYGSAIGRAVHAVLQSVNLTTGAGLEEAVAAQTLTESVVGREEMVRDLARSALASELVQRAASCEHWRETYVGAEQDDGTLLEGYVDLIFREDDGSLVVVDYKTDAIPAGALDSRIVYYRPQMNAYRSCLEAATGLTVRTVLLFLHPSTAVSAEVS